MKKHFSLLLAALLLVLTPALAQKNADDILGVWKTGNGKGMVQIYKQGTQYSGRLVWLKEPNDPKTGKPKLDKSNDEENLRTRPLLGLVNLRDFTFKDGEWTDGKIYDPENGEDYSCTMKMTDANTLEVRGYILVSMFGRTDTWKRQVKK